MQKSKKVCFVTGTRAEYGLLKPIMEKLKAEDKVTLQIVATGSHLSPEFGLSYQEIEQDGFFIDKKIEALLSGDTDTSIAKTMGLTMLLMSEALKDLSPDLVVLLGDRYEIFAVASTAYVLGIPIAHIAGGEITEGALDDGFRHSITKMSALHFVANEEYKKRVIQLGENPSTVFEVGDTGVENSVSLEKLSREDLKKDIDFPVDKPFFLLTYHPVTQGTEEPIDALEEIMQALEQFPEIPVLMTKANADNKGRRINLMLEKYAKEHSNRVKLFDSLGRVRYLSALSYSLAVIGNSSSGLIEAPALNTSTINIGERQKGRMRASSVLDCPPERYEIEAAICQVLSSEWQQSIQSIDNPYGNGREVTAKIKKHIMDFLSDEKVERKKFYDL